MGKSFPVDVIVDFRDLTFQNLRCFLPTVMKELSPDTKLTDRRGQSVALAFTFAESFPIFQSPIRKCNCHSEILKRPRFFLEKERR